MPKIGTPIFINFLITGTAYLPVAKGSPGPFDKKIPFGLWLIISSNEDSTGKTINSKFFETSDRNMFFFAP